MRLVVDQGQMLKIEVGVDLRRSDTGMAEHLLHGARLAAIAAVSRPRLLLQNGCFYRELA